jgi:1,4-alpha-glucan branching enzyme
MGLIISTVEWKWVKFECHAAPGSDVFIAGTFNRWKPSGFDRLRDKKHDGSYRTLLQLKKGRHEYKYLVNGGWLLNPAFSSSVAGESAAVNNVIDVV